MKGSNDYSNRRMDMDHNEHEQHLAQYLKKIDELNEELRKVKRINIRLRKKLRYTSRKLSKLQVESNKNTQHYKNHRVKGRARR